MVAGTVVIADERSTPHCVSDVDGDKNEEDIHDGSERSDAILSGQLHKLEIIQDVHQRRRQIRHELGGTIGTGLPERAQFKPGNDQSQETAVMAQKVKQRDAATDDLTDRGRNCGTCQSPLEYDDKYIV